MTATAIQNLIYYTVSLDKNGGSGGSDSVSVPKWYPMPKIDPPSKSGKTFEGYYLNGTRYYNADGSSANTWDRSSGGTLTANWTDNTYYVAFNANGGTGTMPNQAFTDGEPKNLTPNAFSKAHNSFVGWSRTAGGSAGISDGQSVTWTGGTQGYVINLYAVWNQIVCAVTLDYNGEGTSSETKNVNAGSALSSAWPDGLPRPTRQGYDLTGWFDTDASTGGNKYTSASVAPDQNSLTLYARWEKHGYYIDYDLNGGGTRSTEHVEYDASAEISAPTRTNYSFRGWKLIDNENVLSGDAKWGTTSTVQETSLTLSSLVVNTTQGGNGKVWLKCVSSTKDSHVTLKAMWERNSYTVTVDNSSRNQWSLEVSCSDSQFTHFSGGSEVSVNPSMSASIGADASSSAMTFWAGGHYKVRTTYAKGSYDNLFETIRKWGGVVVAKVSSGSAAGIFDATITMGDGTSNLTQTWTPEYEKIVANVYSPFGDIVPSRAISFAADDTNGTRITVVAGTATGVSFKQWNNVSGTIIESAALSVSPVTFQLLFNGGATVGQDVSLTAEYDKAKISVSATIDALSHTACSGATVTVKNPAGSTITEVEYLDSAEFVISGIPANYRFSGWYLSGEQSTQRTSERYVMSGITDAVSLCAKLKAKVSLSREIEENISGTVQASLTLDGIEYFGSDCSKWVTIGDTYAIGCTPKNDNSVFVCWYDANTGSKSDPLDYEQNESGIVMSDNININAYFLDGTQQYYVAVHSRKAADRAYKVSLGQIVTGATNFSEMTEADYKVAASVMKFGNPQLTARCVRYSGVPEWKCTSTTGLVTKSYSITFSSNKWTYTETTGGSSTTKEKLGTINDESIVFDDSLTVNHTNPLKLGTETLAAQNGKFYLLNGTQMITLAMAKTGNLDYLRTLRFNVDSSIESIYSHDSTVTSIVNQNFVFVIEWGTPEPTYIRATILEGEEYRRQGSVGIGSDASNVNRDDYYVSGGYEKNSVATVIAYPKNGFKFGGWYWDSSFQNRITLANAMYSFEIPDLFSDSKSYKVDNLVSYGNGSSRKMYRCIVAHSPGGFNLDDFSEAVMYAKFVTESIALYKWEGSNSNKTMRWKSKVYALSKPSNLNSVRVDSTGYVSGANPSLRLRIASFSSPDTVPSGSDTLAEPGILIRSQTMRKLPSRRPERYFQVTVENCHEVDAVVIGTSGEGIAK